MTELYYIRLNTGEELISKVEFLEINFQGELDQEIWIEDPLVIRMYQDGTGVLKQALFSWIDPTLLTSNKVSLNPDSILVMNNELSDRIKGVYYTQLENIRKVINTISTIQQEPPKPENFNEEYEPAGPEDFHENLVEYLEFIKDKKRTLN